jgi:hypothetical protein
MAALEARVQRHSANANRPPSADPPWVKPHTSSTPKGTPGARPGHLGHRQALLEPTEVIAVQPPACGCGPTAFPDAHPYDTHQVIEWPDIQMTVQHFVWYAARGSRCGRVTKAPVPPAAAAGYGPRRALLRRVDPQAPVIRRRRKRPSVRVQATGQSHLDPMICTPRKSEGLMIWTTLAPKLTPFGTSGCNANHISALPGHSPPVSLLGLGQLEDIPPDLRP